MGKRTCKFRVGQGSRNIPRPSWQPIRISTATSVIEGCTIRRARETSPMLARPEVSDQASESSQDAAPKGMARADLASWRLAWWWNTSLSLPERDEQGRGVDLSASHCTLSRTSQTRLSSPNRASSPPTRKRLGASPTSHLGMSGPCEATDLQASAGVVQGADGALGGTPHRLGGWSHSARSGRAIQAGDAIIWRTIL